MIKIIYLSALSALLSISQIQKSSLVEAIHLDAKKIQPIDKEKLQLLLSFKKIIEEKSNTTIEFFEPILSVFSQNFKSGFNMSFKLFY